MGSRDDCMSESFRITIFVLSIIVSVLCYTFCFAWRLRVRLLPAEYSLRTVPTNSKVCLRGLLNMREKKILASVIRIQKENWE